MTCWREDFVKVNEYTRPSAKLSAVKKIIVHYTGNPGASAANHQRYFNSTCIEQGRYASAHIFVDKTEAICIIPLNEVAYHANDVQRRNADGSAYRGVAALKPNANFLSIGVEMCIEADGSFHPSTLDRGAQVVAELLKMYGLGVSDVVRHYDVTAKNCPEPFVTQPAAFDAFKQAVQDKLAPVNPPYKVVVPNTALWQAKALVIEYETKGFKCEGLGTPKTDHDACPFVIYTDLEHAKQLVIELKTRGYSLAEGKPM